MHLSPRFFLLEHARESAALVRRHDFAAGVISASTPADWPHCQISAHVAPSETGLALDATLAAPRGTGSTPVAAGWSLRLPDWSREHYLLAPASIYAGNRFRVFPLKYPPYWPSEHFEKNPPVTISDVPRLHADGSPGLVQLLAGALAVPALAVWSPVRREALYFVVDAPFAAGSEVLFEIEEGPASSWCELRASLPGVRATRYVHMTTGQPSPDRSRPIAAGESIRLQARLLTRPADSIEACLAYFAELRDQLASATPAVPPTLPFAEAFRIQSEKFNRDWMERFELFAFNITEGMPFVHSAGWPGVPPFPLAFADSPEIVARARRSLTMLLRDGISPSGFFYGKRETNGDWSADHTRNPADPQLRDRLLARRNGDALYYLLKLAALFEQTGPVSADELAAWNRGFRSVADAFVRLWAREGQFGYLVHQDTGEMLVGGSTSAACAPAALALAAKRFDEPCFLAVAEAAARAYARDFLEKGYTVGAPGEALWCPDSESAGSLVETFATLHDLTGSAEWLRWGRLAADHLATWTVSYAYPFPRDTEFGRLGVNSKGSVFANSQNAHSAPGICTHAGLGLLRLFRATGEARHLRLLRDIARYLPQSLSRADRPITAGRAHDIAAGRGRALPPGWMHERVNTCDWDNNLGGVGHGSCWCEVSLLYSIVELPGVYVDKDSDLLVVIDHVEAERQPDGSLRIHNPTTYDADVRVLAESASERAVPLPLNPGLAYRRVRLAPGETQVVAL